MLNKRIFKIFILSVTFLSSVFLGAQSASAQTASNGQITGYQVPGVTTESSQLIKCGRAGQQMCTLCNLIEGLNLVIKFVMKISVGVGILAFTIAGIMYIVSAGDSGMTGKAKTTMKNAAIGFVIIFAGWVIINTTIMALGVRSQVDANGNTISMFGMNIQGWGKFDCAPNPNR